MEGPLDFSFQGLEEPQHLRSARELGAPLLRNRAPASARRLPGLVAQGRQIAPGCDRHKKKAPNLLGTFCFLGRVLPTQEPAKAQNRPLVGFPVSLAVAGPGVELVVRPNDVLDLCGLHQSINLVDGAGLELAVRAAPLVLRGVCEGLEIVQDGVANQVRSRVHPVKWELTDSQALGLQVSRYHTGVAQRDHLAECRRGISLQDNHGCDVHMRKP
mmetsp:Transcript_72320/g.169356  ORF Transcript_72320/g.169356 Transcript_72320/m.169356 type:complete len:215 (-) Transcript_72320:36-680(-)